jgi:hypothetical protein
MSRLNEAERLAICEKKRKNPSMTQGELVKWAKEKLGKSVSQGTVSNTLKRSAELLADTTVIDAKRKRQSKVKYPELEERLLEWILTFQHTGQLTGETLKTKAEQISSHLYPGESTLTFSQGWLAKFKRRHGLRQFVSHGESGSVDVTIVEEALPDLRDLISRYEPHNVFNADETGLFFRLQANRFLATKQLEGKKLDKQRLTVLACVNASGSEKLPLWVIGKYARPRCFKNINVNSLGCEYKANGKAWMTATLFNSWLQWFSTRMAGREVLLLLDNCPAHTAAMLEIANVTIKFLPPNTTSKLQPLDGGIIRALKAHYRRRQALRTLEQDSSMELQFKPDILDAINMLVPAWEVDVTANTIANCWRHCQLYGMETGQRNREVEEAVSELENVLQRMSCDTIPADELVDYDGEQDVFEMQTEEEFFASLDGEKLVVEDEEDKDETVERPVYTAKQAYAALEILQGYAMQHNDGNGCGRKAVNAYHKFLSDTVMQKQRQTSLPEMFARIEREDID